MKVILYIAFVSITYAFTDVNFHEETIIEYINGLDTTWKAGHNNLRDMPSEDKRRMMTGLKRLPKNQRRVPREKRVPVGWVAPDSFDAREHWPHCPTIPKIQDQGDCGSCWAVAAATVMSDRSCIYSNGTENFQYSMENLIACSNPFTVGDCNGGYIEMAFDYWINTGIVSGGPYQSEEGCQTYSIKPTGPTAKQTPNFDFEEPTPLCKHECREGYQVLYTEDLRYGRDGDYLPQDEEEIKYEIMTGGPVEAGFTVYLDFETYKSGVYQHHSIISMGGHAIRILGWGVEEGTPYWLCANSWNYGWGEGGFFRILRGSNECGIEENVFSGIPKEL